MTADVNVLDRLELLPIAQLAHYAAGNWDCLVHPVGARAVLYGTESGGHGVRCGQASGNGSSRAIAYAGNSDRDVCLLQTSPKGGMA